MKKRIVDKKLLEESREWPCLCCGKIDGYMAHHIQSVGSRGDDVRENLLSVCFGHHRIVETKGLIFLAEQYPAVSFWLLANGWELDDFKGKWVRYES